MCKEMKLMVEYNRDIIKDNHLIYVVNIDDYSYNSYNSYNLEESKLIIDQLKNEKYPVGINLERLYFDNELPNLKSYVDFVKEKIDFITYSDYGIYYLFKDYPFKKIYHASTMITSSKDLNQLLTFSDCLIGKEISLDELTKLLANASGTVGLEIFGKYPIFYSRRHLLSTFNDYKEKTINLSKGNFTLVEETRSDLHPIIEYNYGTIVYEHVFYYLKEELDNLPNISYGFISHQFIDNSKYNELIEAYLNNQDLHTLGLDLYKGKLDLKTILTKGGNE